MASEATPAQRKMQHVIQPFVQPLTTFGERWRQGEERKDALGDGLRPSATFDEGASGRFTRERS